MLDFDLAVMYGVETKRLKEQVRRNLERFPDDFMFQLYAEEWSDLRSQFATSSWGGTRYAPFAFTEQGVAMLSGLLNSSTAIEVNINIMRAFVFIRNYLANQASPSKEITDLWHHIRLLEQQSEENLKAINDLSEENQNTFDEIYLALTQLADKHSSISKPRNVVGYVKPQKK